MDITIIGGEITAAQDSRTITGLLLPYGEIGMTDYGQFQVNAGDITIPADVSVIGLNTDHDRYAPVGRATRVWEQPQGIMASFTLANTPEGDAALADARNPHGKRRRLSAEFVVDILAGRTVPGTGHLSGGALVPMGAFPSAMVLASATNTTTAQNGATPMSTPTIPEVRQEGAPLTGTLPGVPAQAAPVAEQTPVAPVAEQAPAAQAVPVAAAIAAPVVPVPVAPIPGAATSGAPAATTTPRGPARQEILAAIRSIRSGMQDPDSVRILAAIADIPASGAGALPGANVVQQSWLGHLYQGVVYQRQYAPLLNLGTDISLGGKRGFKVWRGTGPGPTQAPGSGGWAGFPAQIGGYQGNSSVFGSTLDRFVLGNAIDRALIDLPGGIEVLDAFLSLVIEDYQIWSDEKARQKIVAQPIGGPVAAKALPAGVTYPKAIGMLIQGILAVKKLKADKRKDVPTFAIMNDIAFEQAAYAVGGAQNLPAFVNLVLTTQRDGAVDGDVTVVNGDTGIQSTESVIVGAKLGIDLDEVPGGISINALELARGGVDQALHGWLQTFVKRPEAFAHIGTADARANTTAYNVGQLVVLGAGVVQAQAPADPTALTAGTTGGSAPALPGAVGGTVVDGTVTWVRVA